MNRTALARIQCTEPHCPCNGLRLPLHGQNACSARHQLRFYVDLSLHESLLWWTLLPSMVQQRHRQLKRSCSQRRNERSSIRVLVFQDPKVLLPCS